MSSLIENTVHGHYKDQYLNWKFNETLIMEPLIITFPVKHKQFIIIRAATCFDRTGSSSGLHNEPVNYKAAYIIGIPNNVYK